MADYVMRLFKLGPYRCRECQSRFYLPAAFDARIRAQSKWLRESERSRRRSKRRSASV